MHLLLSILHLHKKERNSDEKKTTYNWIRRNIHNGEQSAVFNFRARETNLQHVVITILVFIINKSHKATEKISQK